MSAAPSYAPERTRPDADEHIILYGMAWRDYETLLAVRGDRAGVRVYYLRGAIEIRRSSRGHEWMKKSLSRLLEAYCDERGVELSGYGSWTLRSAPKERGAEPDECYMVGATDKDSPDLAIEVIWTHGGLDKLEIYRGLGVAEVWMWDRDEGLRVHALRGDHYEVRERSQFFPELDLAWLARFLDKPTQSQAVRALRESLR